MRSAVIDRPSRPPRVLRTGAADIQRGDQVAFVSPGGCDHVAGGVTRCSGRGGAVELVVDDVVYALPGDHSVIIIRTLAVTAS